MATRVLSPGEHLVTLIKQIATEQQFGHTDTHVTMEPLSSPEDYPQFKFKITISHESREDLELFAKVTELNHNNWDNVIIKPYEKERLFYTSLVKTYRQLEDKHGLSEQDRLKLPALYAAEAAHTREVLVLEDLTSRGFGFASRFESVSYPYAAAAVTELAKFHALSMAFKHESLDEFETLATQLPTGLIERNAETDVLFESFKSLSMKAVSSENKKKLKTYYKSQNLTTFNDMLKPLNRKVILHGHFWPKNMLHKVSNDGTVEVIPVDYANIQVGSPVTDLLHFIYTATDSAFRGQHYGELFHHYFSELIQAAGRLGLDIAQEYSNEALESEMKEKLPYGLLSAVAYLPILAFDDRADRVRGVTGDRKPFDIAAGALYSIRVNEVVCAYANSGLLDSQPKAQKGKPCGMCFLC